MQATELILEGRQARCSYCKTIQPSSRELPFFEFRGEGSYDALNGCRHCGYFEVAHKSPLPRHLAGRCCDHFESRGAMEYDLYYCGCKGWD